MDVCFAGNSLSNQHCRRRRSYSSCTVHTNVIIAGIDMMCCCIIMSAGGSPLVGGGGGEGGGRGGGGGGGGLCLVHMFKHWNLLARPVTKYSNSITSSQLFVHLPIGVFPASVSVCFLFVCFGSDSV